MTAKSLSWQLLPSLHGRQCETRSPADSPDRPSVCPSIYSSIPPSIHLSIHPSTSLPISVCTCFKPGECPEGCPGELSAAVCVPVLAHTELVSSSTRQLLRGFSWAGESRGARGRAEKAEGARRSQCWHHWASPLGFCSPLSLAIHALALQSSLGDSRGEGKALLPLLPWSFYSH